MRRLSVILTAATALACFTAPATAQAEQTAPTTTAPGTTPPACGEQAVDIFVGGREYSRGSEAARAAAAVWGACGISTSSTKIVRTSTGRVDSPDTLPGTCNLLCGNESGDGSGWGYRHIQFRHGDQGEWGELSFMTGENWRDLADFVIEQTLQVPASTTPPQSNDTIAYRAPLQFKDIDDGSVVAEYTVVVSIARETKNIITAFPEGF